MRNRTRETIKIANIIFIEITVFCTLARAYSQFIHLTPYDLQGHPKEKRLHKRRKINIQGTSLVTTGYEVKITSIGRCIAGIK